MISQMMANLPLSSRQTSAISTLTTNSLETIPSLASTKSGLSFGTIPGLMYQFLLRKDGSLSFLFLSPNFADFFQLKGDGMDLDTETLVAMIHPDERDYFYDSINNSAEALVSWNWLGRFILPSGEIKWLHWDAQPSRQANGNIFWNGLLVDVTSQKQLNDEVEKLSFLLGLTERLQSSSQICEIASIALTYLVQATNAAFGDVKAIRRYEDKWQSFCLANYVSSQVVTRCGEKVATEIMAALQKSEDQHQKMLQQVVKNSAILVIEDYASNLSFSIDSCELPGGQIIMFPIPAADGTVVGILTLHSNDPEPIQNSRLKEIVLAASSILGARIEQVKAREEIYQDNLQFESAYEHLRQQTKQLEQALCKLQETQLQLIQSEKMSDLVSLVAGIAHEISNPVSFIHHNLPFAPKYFQDMFYLRESHQKYWVHSMGKIEELTEEIDLSYLQKDLQIIFASIETSSERITDIVPCLPKFSRLDESELKPANIHEVIENSLLLLNNRFKAQHWRPAIEVIKNYGNLPRVECYVGALNQMFMNILSNAIDDLEESFATSYLDIKQNKGQITIRTELKSGNILISISDNGFTITPSLQSRFFEPFFTLKPAEKATGLGLSISYRIIR